MGGLAVSAPRRFPGAAWTRAVAAACLLLVLACAAPGRAWATYADYDETRAAAQELGSYGSEIRAADIPDGTYEVAARTDSYMCIFYRSAEDAAAKTSKERCYVQVSGGKMVAVFYISSMYNRLYLGGDARVAASLTNADGTDDSNYLTGDPAEGYVPHLYLMAIPALNYPMEFAAFAGAQYPVSADPESAWHTRARWYSRVVVFKPTQETLRAIDDARNAGGKSENPDNSGNPAAAGPGSDGGSGGGPGDASGGAAGGQAPTSSGAPVPVPTAASGDSLAAIAASAAPAAADQPVDDAPADGDAASGGAAAPGGRRGLVMSAASFDLPADLVEGDVDVARADDGAAEGGRDPMAALVLGAATLAAAGAGCRLAMFTLSKRTGRLRRPATP